MSWQRETIRILAVAVVLAIVLSLAPPLTKEVDAGITFITFLATGGPFACQIFAINFFSSPIRLTLDTAVATRRTNTQVTFDLAGFEGIQINCAGITGGGTGTQFMSTFGQWGPSLPPQMFGFIVLPDGSVVVPFHFALFT